MVSPCATRHRARARRHLSFPTTMVSTRLNLTDGHREFATHPVQSNHPRPFQPQTAVKTMASAVWSTSWCVHLYS
jgi:hypothetical protein